MTTAAFIQLAVSAIAVALMTGLAAWAARGRGAPALDEAAARGLLAEEFPDCVIETVWLAADGRGAVAKSADAALILARMGDGYLARKLAWTSAAAAPLDGGKLRLPLREPGAPGAVLAFTVWPPKGAAA